MIIIPWLMADQTLRLTYSSIIKTLISGKLNSKLQVLGVKLGALEQEEWIHDLWLIWLIIRVQFTTASRACQTHTSKWCITYADKLARSHP